MSIYEKQINVCIYVRWSAHVLLLLYMYVLCYACICELYEQACEVLCMYASSGRIHVRESG